MFTLLGLMNATCSLCLLNEEIMNEKEVDQKRTSKISSFCRFLGKVSVILYVVS